MQIKISSVHWNAICLSYCCSHKTWRRQERKEKVLQQIVLLHNNRLPNILSTLRCMLYSMQPWLNKKKQHKNLKSTARLECINDQECLISNALNVSDSQQWMIGMRSKKMIVDCQSLECTHIEYGIDEFTFGMKIIMRENGKKDQNATNKWANQQCFVLSPISDASNTANLCQVLTDHVNARSMHPYFVFLYYWELLANASH